MKRKIKYLKTLVAVMPLVLIAPVKVGLEQAVKPVEVMKLVKPSGEVAPGSAFQKNLNERIDKFALKLGIDRKDLISSFWSKYGANDALEMLVAAYHLKWENRYTSEWTFSADGVGQPIVIDINGLAPLDNLTTGINFTRQNEALFNYKKANQFDITSSSQWPRVEEMKTLSSKRMRSILEETPLGAKFKNQSFTCRLNDWVIQNGSVKKLDFSVYMNWTLETPYQPIYDNKPLSGLMWVVINKN